MEARPNFAKTKRGASGGFLPRPLLLRLRHPNSEKRNQPKFCGILSPENCFRKTSSALFQISSSGLLSKKVRILYNEYRKNKTAFVQFYFVEKSKQWILLAWEIRSLFEHFIESYEAKRKSKRG
ncbi:MAG: hypothetical protein WCJ59_02435 [bacterium]